MKGRYILSAVNDWNGESALKPLPVTIPEDKLKEIGMVHPPFPPIHQLTYNDDVFGLNFTEPTPADWII